MPARSWTPVHISSFHGMDKNRSSSRNIEYGVAEICKNIGRDERSPLHPRRGLCPTSASTNNTEQSGRILSMGALAQGTRLVIAARLGGNIVAIKDVVPKSVVEP